MADDSGSAIKNRVNFSFDLKWIILLLLAVIVAMLLVWKPWTGVSGSDRTVQVTGEAKISAEPDEFVFYPAYDFKNADKDAALTALSKKSDEIVAKLKELGVDSKQIKTDSTGYDFPYYADKTSDVLTYSLRFTITVDSLELAQKVQDYLLTTAPTGSVSPQAAFSQEKRKVLESEARDKATKEAREKAEQSARNLSFKVGKVKEVSDGQGFSILPYEKGIALDSTEQSASPSLSVQPGQNDLTYTVTVTFFVK